MKTPTTAPQNRRVFAHTAKLNGVSSAPDGLLQIPIRAEAENLRQPHDQSRHLSARESETDMKKTFLPPVPVDATRDRSKVWRHLLLLL